MKNSKAYSYMIMPLYGVNLHELFVKRRAKFSTESIYSLGLQVLDILELVHKAGLVFNDLKLDNLLLDYGVDIDKLSTTKENIFEKYNVNLIDFGFSTSYIND